jgi:hypothetical protein
MRHTSFVNIICNILLLSVISSPVMASEPLKRYELRDFFGKPKRSFFRLSPDGKTLGFMQPYKRRENLFVVPPTSDGKAPDFAKARRLTAETQRDIAGYFWKGNDHILYVKDFGGDENFHVVSVYVRSGKVKDLTPLQKVRASIVDDLRDDPHHVLVKHNKRDPKVFDVYRINVLKSKLTTRHHHFDDHVE